MAGGGGLAQQVSVPAGSARPVAFSVVPTAAASVSLKVVARGSIENFVGDAVSKILQIEVSDRPNLGPGSRLCSLVSAGQTRAQRPNLVHC